MNRRLPDSPTLRNLTRPSSRAQELPKGAPVVPAMLPAAQPKPPSAALAGLAQQYSKLPAPPAYPSPDGTMPQPAGKPGGGMAQKASALTAAPAAAPAIAPPMGPAKAPQSALSGLAMQYGKLPAFDAGAYGTGMATPLAYTPGTPIPGPQGNAALGLNMNAQPAKSGDVFSGLLSQYGGGVGKTAESVQAAGQVSKQHAIDMEEAANAKATTDAIAWGTGDAEAKAGLAEQDAADAAAFAQHERTGMWPDQQRAADAAYPNKGERVYTGAPVGETHAAEVAPGGDGVYDSTTGQQIGTTGLGASSSSTSDPGTGDNFQGAVEAALLKWIQDNPGLSDEEIQGMVGKLEAEANKQKSAASQSLAARGFGASIGPTGMMYGSVDADLMNKVGDLEFQAGLAREEAEQQKASTLAGLYGQDAALEQNAEQFAATHGLDVDKFKATLADQNEADAWQMVSNVLTWQKEIGVDPATIGAMTAAASQDSDGDGVPDMPMTEVMSHLSGWPPVWNDSPGQTSSPSGTPFAELSAQDQDTAIGQAYENIPGLGGLNGDEYSSAIAAWLNQNGYPGVSYEDVNAYMAAHPATEVG